MSDTNSIEAKKKYEEKRKILLDKKQDIIKFYLHDPNVKEIERKYGIPYSYIQNMLKEEGIYRALETGYRDSESRRIKQLSTLNEKYGNDIINVGQLHLSRLKERNNIEYVKCNFSKDLDLYNKKVNSISTRNKKYIIDTGFCYYTGIQFIDNIVGNSSDVNPNDPRKKTLEHKISLYDGWLNNIDHEIISSPSNLVWSLRYVNTIKGNMSNNQFYKFAKILRKKLINEGFPHN